ncbi:Neutral ceramidase 2 [Linum grandiflorum]
MFQRSHYQVLLPVLLALAVNGLVNGEFLIGMGSYDMTGPAAQVNLMGYANIQQNAAGIHFRLRARTFIVAESETGPRFAFANLDAGMASQLVTIRVLERLKSRYGSLYTQENVAISGTHTHAGPGGYLQYVLYIVTSLGFVRISSNTITTIKCLFPGEVENAGINRSPSAYLMNPPEERAKYDSDVDKEMTLLKFVDEATGNSVGAFSWYATHGTSMSRDNKLISGDNKGAAARFFEDWFASTNTSSSSSADAMDVVKLRDKAGTVKATGGRTCRKKTSQKFRVRKGRKFVGAFCQSNVGDVTPNVLGAFCVDTGNPCDFNRSSCGGNDQLCVGRGPGYPDETLSTKMIGERQFKKAVELFTTGTDKLDTKIDYRHIYLNFTSIQVEVEGKGTVTTCPAAVGPGFAAGTTDGPGAFGFQQGDTEIDPFLKLVRDFIKKPTQYQEDCQKPKPVLLSTGEMFDPYPWAPAILPIQILRLGKVIILSVPGEFTTMAGRRLKETVKETLIANGRGEFDDTTHVVIAGLTNTYSQYISTFEEYQHQRYEAASTLYGPHTLSAYIQEFNKLATQLAKGETTTNNKFGLSPPDLLSRQFGLLIEPMGESPPKGVKFGDIKQDVVGQYFKSGDRVSATFWSADPRYDLLTEGTFAGVEMLLQGGKKWVPMFDDDDLSLRFEWGVDNATSCSLATVEWEIPDEASSGVYRLRHFGSAKETIISQVGYFTGASSGFAVG